MKKIILLLFSIVIFGGCYGFHPLQIASSTIPLNPSDYTIIEQVEGKCCDVRFLGFIHLWGDTNIPAVSNNRLQNAIDKALKSKGGDALINVTVDTYYAHYLIITEYCTFVKGTAVKLR